MKLNWNGREGERYEGRFGGQGRGGGVGGGGRDRGLRLREQEWEKKREREGEKRYIERKEGACIHSGLNSLKMSLQFICTLSKTLKEILTVFQEAAG